MNIDKLLLNNREWAERTMQEQPGFFEHLSKGQAPESLWIGCADSRVPPVTLLDLPPGSLFVHRNIANVVALSDPNCLSVIYYAVEVLKVENIIVCGHYGCGGINASLESPVSECIDGWLDHIRDVYQIHRRELETIEDFEKRSDRLCELNVIEQVAHVCATVSVSNAWATGEELSIHGWIYDVKNGLIKDLQVSTAGP
jgi:carbonic anhydrase